MGQEIMSNWLGPMFVMAVATFALIFIKDRKFMQLISFLGVASVVGVLLFAGPSLFGVETTDTEVDNPKKISPVHCEDKEATYDEATGTCTK